MSGPGGPDRFEGFDHDEFEDDSGDGCGHGDGTGRADDGTRRGDGVGRADDGTGRADGTGDERDRDRGGAGGGAGGGEAGSGAGGPGGPAGGSRSEGAGPPLIPPPRPPAEDGTDWQGPGGATQRGGTPRARVEPPEPSGAAEPGKPSDPDRPSDPGKPSDPNQTSGPGEPPTGHRRPTTPRTPPVPAGRRPSPTGRARPPTASPTHTVLKSLLGAWALAACSGEETAAVEAHLNDCVPCAEEALRLRDAVGLLHHEDSLDLDPRLRTRVLTGCLDRRPARIPVPEWASAYDAEAARLDALLRDMGGAEWRAPVRLKWFDGKRLVGRDTTVHGVMGHLMAVDGLLAASLGLPDPLGAGAPASPERRTEAFWRAEPTDPEGPHAEPGAGPDRGSGAGPGDGPGDGVRGGSQGHGIFGRGIAAGVPSAYRSGAPPGTLREAWREQAHSLVRTVSFAGRGTADLPVPYDGSSLPVHDAFLDRAFACWVHAGDIADAVDYPYKPPSATHLHHMIDLCARLLPDALAKRRRDGLAGPPRRLGAAGALGRSLRLEIEGSGGGHWFIALDSPGALAGPDGEVAHIALDRDAFYQLAAGHVPPLDAAAGQVGDPEAIRDVLFATASLSRL
ncbi:zf-HC2 domain-containing protein [Streptomyces sp. XD-27]|uniref:zf-HC2 domain-containing protein n=1 Tax=Streptomyces sp. XD-27 TaxID=3062779 RepID=UPI0026F450E9|nr:zf-HC2 domain-containing protein [Streptomyces sp. XD-27]WKX70936.1 zf-HC2 domain-containing protein [Streptomyces sp. XD-27]